MILHIKNMVCLHCIVALKQLLKELEIPYTHIELGSVYLPESITDEKRKMLAAELKNLGLDLIDDKRSRVIDKIKTTIIKLVRQEDAEEVNKNISSILEETLNYDYNYLSSLFSATEGTTIEKYVIAQKIDRVKELLVYDEMSLSQIAFKMGYSSTAHLSNQFKKVTGLTPSYFKKVKEQRKNFQEV